MSAVSVLLYRIRVVLKMTDYTELHPFQAPVVHALLAQANGRGFQSDPVVPEGLLLDAPEQCRIALRPGDKYAFGFTLLTGSRQEADGRIAALIRGLYSLGDKAARGVKLGGNFRVEVVNGFVQTVVSIGP